MSRPGHRRTPAGQRTAQSLGFRARQALAEPVRRFQLAVLILLGLVAVGTAGYMLLEGMTVPEALYMTVITLTTVGFREVRPLSTESQMFTVTLLVFGVAFGAWALTNAVEVALGQTLWTSVERRKMKDTVARLTDHYVVCGYGRFGTQIVRDLRARGEAFVVVEQSAEREEEFLRDGIVHVLGDATHDETLADAGIARARGMVTALDSDASNVLSVLTARELSPRVLIVARANAESSESKLRRAGADRVVTPDTLGGHRLALALLRPAVHDFLSGIFSFGADVDVDLGQLIVPERSPFAGQTVAGCDLRRIRNVSILAIRDSDGRFAFNPDAGRVIAPGETLILIGPAEAIYDLEAMYGDTA